MSLVFWRKTKNTGGAKVTESVAVDETNPLPVTLIDNEDQDPQRVSIDMAYQPPVAGETRKYQLEIPGIGTGSAYSTLDALGTLITIPNVFRESKNSGTIVKVLLHDLDDEGLQVDIVFFDRPITTTADNDPLALSDTDSLAWEGTIVVSTFSDFANNQGGQNTSDRLWVVSQDRNLYCRCQAQGALNIAASNIPRVSFYVVPD